MRYRMDRFAHRARDDAAQVIRLNLGVDVIPVSRNA
jgi:hypothetical protein